MPTFEWIFDKLVGQETPLALGFAGMMMAGGLILLVYSTLSRIGIVGSGKAEKLNETLRADVMRLITEKAALESEKARYEERCKVQAYQIEQMRIDYDRDIAEEKMRSQVLIERVEQIAKLESKLNPRNRRDRP